MVLWTSANKKFLAELNKNGVDLDPFSLLITGEDYQRKTKKRKDFFKQAVSSCSWLDEAVKENLLGTTKIKTPVLLTNRPFIFIEDYCHYLQQQGIKDSWFINLYPFGSRPTEN